MDFNVIYNGFVWILKDDENIAFSTSEYEQTSSQKVSLLANQSQKKIKLIFFSSSMDSDMSMIGYNV